MSSQTPMPCLTFTRSTLGLPGVTGHDSNEQFNIDLALYANNLLHRRIQDTFGGGQGGFRGAVGTGDVGRVIIYGMEIS